MLLDKIIRMGYILQMVNEFPQNSNHGSHRYLGVGVRNFWRGVREKGGSSEPPNPLWLRA